MKLKDLIQDFEQLLRKISECEDELAVEISGLAKRKEWHRIQEQMEYAKKIRVLASKMRSFKEEWETVVNGGTNSSDRLQQERSRDIPVEERTQWVREGDKIRVITRSGRSEYTNVIPLSLFREVALSVLDFSRKNGSVRISDILNQNRNLIISSSEYKKSPRMPIYIVFKILLKEKILQHDEVNSRVYVLTDEGALVQFLEQL